MTVSWGRTKVALGHATQGWHRVWPALLLAAVCFGILSAFVVSTIAARDRQLESAQDATTNLARSLADHAESTLRVAELTVSALISLLEKDGTDRASLAAIHATLSETLPTSGRLQDAMVFDGHGRFMVGANATFMEPSGAAEAIEWHREQVTTDVHVGPPVKGWVASGWSILLSRRLNETDGSFLGVAIVAIDMDYFAKTYHALRLGPQGAIALTSGRGQLLARTRTAPETIGTDVSNGSFFRHYALHGPVGPMTVDSPIDGIRRQGAYRAVAGYPLVVFVALAVDDVLAGWWRDTLMYGAAVGLLVLCTAMLGVRLSQLVRSHRLAARAAQASERLYRLLAVNGTDVIVQLGADLRHRYVSPASQDVLGYAPEMMLNRSAGDNVHPDDQAAVADMMAELRSTDEPRSVTFRFRRPEGTYIWLEASVRALSGGDGFVGALRDVSARVAVQAKLHDANNRLQRLVMLDGLTGIANRRCLDKFLEREFRRASREEQPLAVLMIDADRFKLYNDTNGHQAGDECLCAIAAAIQRVMRRAGDLAARYGGEEFAVLLPHTDEAGAAAMAEMIRAEVQALAIPHAGSSTGMVTISVGVAVAHPGRDAATAGALLAAADAALYRAKSAGRNRIECAGPLRQMDAPIRLELLVEADF